MGNLGRLLESVSFHTGTSVYFNCDTFSYSDCCTWTFYGHWFLWITLFVLH